MVGHFGAKEEKDWNFVNENLHGKCAGILVSPDKECRIPVFYKRNSLSVLACVRRVETTVHSIRGVTVTFKMDVGNHWEVIELCEKTTPKNDNPIPGLVFATQILTFPSRSLVPLSSFECEIVGAEDLPSIPTGLQVPPLPVDQLGKPEHFFPREPGVPEELARARDCEQRQGWRTS